MRPADVDETPLPGETPTAMVERLARAKVAAVSAGDGETHALAADTVVVIDQSILGKPTDERDARRMLGILAGREHLVFTGVALCEISTGRIVFTVDETRVRIAALTAEEIAAYVATGHPMDKAGAYGIQEMGATFVESISGNYTNVVGLPLPTVTRLLRQLGLDWNDFR